MAKIPILIIKSMGNASNIINSVFTIFFIITSLPALNDNINGNILTYNESEDAYYIQHGADAVPKKLGEPSVFEPIFFCESGTNKQPLDETFTVAKSGFMMIVSGGLGYGFITITQNNVNRESKQYQDSLGNSRRLSISAFAVKSGDKIGIKSTISEDKSYRGVLAAAMMIS